MHIIETYFDVCGFDHRLIQGGTSIYLWNLSRSFAKHGHQVSVVAPAHGRMDDLRQHHDVEVLPYEDAYVLPIMLDPRIWKDGFPGEARIPLRTVAYRLAVDGVDFYFLSNALLDRLPETFYPPYDAKGRDLVFFKPLAFQVDSVRFIRRQFAGQRAVVHAHEPYYHYLLPAAFKSDPDKRIACTVQSNMPITKMVYRPKVRRLLDLLGAPVELPEEGGGLSGDAAAMSQYQRLTHLHYEYPPDNVNIFALVAEHADCIDYLSPGQRDFYSTFADTAFEQLFKQLPISAVVRRNAHKQFVGGCAISDWWLAADPKAVDRAAILKELGLDPALPTFFHNARYAVNHKGQVELMRAIDQALGSGLQANFIVRCLSGVGIDNPYFHEVAGRYTGKVHLEWRQVDEPRMFAYAASADFCIFPSKFEMDTFLIAQGEAMVCGAVSIATAQYGMAHFGHVEDPLDGPDAERATGFAVRRSFVEDDALLVAALVDRIERAVRLLRERPEDYRRLSANAVANASRFNWDHCADQHLEAFTPLREGSPPTLSDEVALRYGWFDMLSPEAWARRPVEIAETAKALGDADVYRRCRPLDETALRALFDAAYERADFDRCGQIAGPGSPPDLASRMERIRQRCRIVGGQPGAPSWQVHYYLPQADRVELVFAGTSPMERATAIVHRLERSGEGFAATVNGPPPQAGLAFVLTLRSGRVTWDCVSPCLG